MKAIASILCLLITCAGCATVRNSSRASLVLDETSICALGWSNRWWIEDDNLFAGEWQEGREPRRGHSIRAVATLSASQMSRLRESLVWMTQLESGTHDVTFQEPFDLLRLTSSPTYALDYTASDGRRILVAEFPFAQMAPVIAILNEALPKHAQINWQLVGHPYRTLKRPNKAPEPTPVSVTPRATEGVSR